MKFLDSHYEEYIQSVNNVSLHPTITKKLQSFPDNLNEVKNVIFYGPSGVGKYSQVLNCIKKYSNSELKYEKKLTVSFNKNNYFFKISDIHFEIDMSLLGCNSKLLWNEIYINIIDVLSARVNKSGIILCKNFHKIHSELLECFYSYIQRNNTDVNLVFFLVTENISFIPDNIINNFYTISIPRPTKLNYNKILNKKITGLTNVKDISNIKNELTNTNSFRTNIIKYVDKLYTVIDNPDTLKFTQFRDLIYDIFIYDMEIGYVLWLLLSKLILNKKLSQDNLTKVYLDTFSFLQFYNNNYRPIYHLENYLYNLINKIHGL
jgi:hypothetical protein